MKVGSLFAGIGGFDLGFERAGFEVAWCVEWDKNAQAVLRKRFPNAQVYGDIREVDPDKLERVDVICGGFPCQDLSVAGKRAGLAGERSGLFHDAMRIVRQLRPSILILENVPGLLSSNRGLDFATVLREVGEGWDCAEVGWRVLDSQYFGVAQRRRRVFVVAGSRAGCAEQILALAEGGGGDPPSRDEARKDAPSDAAGGTGIGSWWDGSDCSATLTKKNADGSQRMPDKGNLGAVVIDRAAFNQGTNAAYEPRIEQSESMSALVARVPHAVAHAFYSTGGTHGVNQDSEICPPLKIGSALGIPSPPAVCFSCKDHGADASEIAPTMRAMPHRQSHQNGGGQIAVAFKVGNSSKARSDGLSVEHSPTLGSSAGGNTVPAVAFTCSEQSNSFAWERPIFPTITAQRPSDTSNLQTGIRVGMVVRRLTPVECERLQGFPDGWTQIGTDKPTADTHRYKQLGNAVTVNVAEWIARRTMAWLT